jgi:hypothetical protein
MARCPRKCVLPFLTCGLVAVAGVGSSTAGVGPTSPASDESTTGSAGAQIRTTNASQSLDFFTFYDWAPERQHGWSFGLSPSLSDIASAHAAYGMPSMFGDLVHSCLVSPTAGCNDTAAAHQKVLVSGTINRGNVLDPMWRRNVALLASRLRPWIANGTVLGVFIGDELTINALRDDLGPGVGLIYSALALENPFGLIRLAP